MTPNLELADHIKVIEGKLMFLRGQLSPILQEGKASFNLSLFRTLAFPLYRLVLPLYDMAEEADRDAFRVHTRRQTRAFLRIPPNSANHIIWGLLGDLGPMATDVCAACDSRLMCRERIRPSDSKLLWTLKEPPPPPHSTYRTPI